MDWNYYVSVTVHGANPLLFPDSGWGFLIKAHCPAEARRIALEAALAKKIQHPHKYKNATFSVDHIQDLPEEQEGSK